jgi:uncharacterized protein
MKRAADAALAPQHVATRFIERRCVVVQPSHTCGYPWWPVANRVAAAVSRRPGSAVRQRPLNRARDTARAMSQENVEVVRAGFEAWNAGDMDAFRELLAPEVSLRPVEDWPEPGPFVGREPVLRWLGQLRDAWDADALEATSDFIDAADRVIVRFTWRGVGHGPQSNMEFTGVWTVRKGRLALVEFFWDHAEALEAAGLSE